MKRKIYVMLLVFTMIFSFAFVFEPVQAYSGYSFAQLDSWSANCHQGVCVNETFIWAWDSGASGTNGYIYQYNKATHSLIDSESTEPQIDYQNAGAYHNGILYACGMYGDVTDGGARDESVSEIGLWWANNLTYWKSYDLARNTSEDMYWYDGYWYMCFHWWSVVCKYDSELNLITTYSEILDNEGSACTSPDPRVGYQGIALWEEGTNGTFLGLTRHGTCDNHLFIYWYNSTSDEFEFVEEVTNDYFNQGWDLDQDDNISVAWVADRTGGDVIRKLSCNAEWEEVEEDTPVFVSINGQGNNTQTFNQNRSFVWTKISGATKYQMQVSNSSLFGTTFINLDNISEGSGLESMPGGDYYENSTHVFFVLPYAYNITFYNSHYYRVRAYTS